jgi:hypothetical protein
MSTPLAVAAGSTGSPFVTAVQRAARRLGPRTLGATLLVALALQAWLLVEIRNAYETMSAAEPYLSGTIINVCMSLCIMFATLVADEWVDLGARRLPAYVGAVVAGAAAGSFAQWLAHHWLSVVPVSPPLVPTTNPLHDVSGRLHIAAVDMTQPAVMFFEFLIWGSIIVFIYVELRAARRAHERMTAAYVARARAQRRTLESRLQALQARVEPQFLFNTLARVRDLYAEDPREGARMLGDLIDYLRAALPHLRDSGSTLGQEIELAAAYLRIVHADHRSGMTLEVDAPVEALAARVPAMVLLPLIDHVLVAEGRAVAADDAVRVSARVSELRLWIAVSFVGRPLKRALDAAVLVDLRERLRGLYGDAARLELEPAAGAPATIVMEIPYEAADGGHR